MGLADFYIEAMRNSPRAEERRLNWEIQRENARGRQQGIDSLAERALQGINSAGETALKGIGLMGDLQQRRIDAKQKADAAAEELRRWQVEQENKTREMDFRKAKYASDEQFRKGEAERQAKQFAESNKISKGNLEVSQGNLNINREQENRKVADERAIAAYKEAQDLKAKIDAIETRQSVGEPGGEPLGMSMSPRPPRMVAVRGEDGSTHWVQEQDGEQRESSEYLKGLQKRLDELKSVYEGNAAVVKFATSLENARADDELARERFNAGAPGRALTNQNKELQTVESLEDHIYKSLVAEHAERNGMSFIPERNKAKEAEFRGVASRLAVQGHEAWVKAGQPGNLFSYADATLGQAVK